MNPLFYFYLFLGKKDGNIFVKQRVIYETLYRKRTMDSAQTKEGQIYKEPAKERAISKALSFP